MTGPPGQEFTFYPAESEYWKAWVILNRFGKTLEEWDRQPIEIQNALWTMLKYENEKAKSDSFKANSRNADKK